MFKAIIAIIIIIVVGGLGYWIYQSTITPEETEDEISVLLGDLKQETGIDFSEIQPVEIKWNIKKYEEIEKVDISGKGFEATDISSEQYDSVESFLIDRGFEVDLYNIADGLFTGLVGYKKDQIVCTVSGGSTPQEPDIKDIKVKCGKGDGSIEHLFSKEELIKKLFAQKYKTKVSAIVIDISQETANHVKGTIRVLDELAEGGAGDRGMFLAAKVNDDWKLVHDGQGVVPCLVAAEYNFPADMVKQCVGGDTIVEDRREEACLKSGGQVTTSLCCKSTEDYPNLCLIGPCGCSPDNSHEVNICDCEERKCFDGNTCVPEINSFDDCVEAGYAVLPPTPGGYTECRTPDGKVFYFEEIIVSPCAKNGELLKEPDKYCCEGLKEWPIPDTRFSIADVCYEVGEPSEILMRMCIKCGDGLCESHLMYNENPCNCPEDCKGKNKSMFQSIEEFCLSNDWKVSLSKACEETIKDSPICELCAF